jgi:SAM-dependent methyltransferase
VATTTSKYREFWAGQTSPLHRYDDGPTYKAYAKELQNLFAYFGYADGNVLEIGCGNGALFPHLGFAIERYLGIDFCAPMLKTFRENCPGVRLIEGDAAAYQPDAKYDLIFGNAVHQHFSPDMLKQHLSQVLPSLAKGGMYVLANLPYRPLKQRHRFGEFDSNRRLVKLSARQRLKHAAKRVVIRVMNAFKAEADGIGYWYSPDDVLAFIGPRYVVEVLGSNFYPYRQHVVIRSADHAA